MTENNFPTEFLFYVFCEETNSNIPDIEKPVTAYCTVEYLYNFQGLFLQKNWLVKANAKASSRKIRNRKKDIAAKVSPLG